MMTVNDNACIGGKPLKDIYGKQTKWSCSLHVSTLTILKFLCVFLVVFSYGIRGADVASQEHW